MISGEIMEFIIKIIILEIVTIFPFLIFNFKNTKAKIYKEKESNVYFDLAALSSLFLLVETSTYLNVEKYIIIAIIPLIVTLLKKEYITFMAILFIFSIFYETTSNCDNYFLVITILLLLILYFFHRKNKLSKKNFINLYGILTVFLIAGFYYFCISRDVDFLENFFKLVFCFTLSLKLANDTVISSDEIMMFRNNILEFEKEKELKNSLFKITHEIKNPIAVIKGYLDMFDIEDEEKSIRYIKIIKQEVCRTLNLLNDFLLFTKVKIEKEVINFNELLSECKELLIPFIENKKCLYSFEAEDDIYVSLDFNKIKQVIINIVKNSVEASDENSYIYLKAFKDKKNLIILIIDHGQGMSKETVERIQNPFYTTKVNGTGLGVSLSKEIIEAHKGKLNYDSTLGKGTTVKIILPVD